MTNGKGDLKASEFYRVAREGEVNESISIDISFRIIRQFSLQLYDNPRRAIEELVCNSYDANAENCHIQTPENIDDSLYVLDNGHSMDMEGLRWLWKVAASRKDEELGDERVKGGRQQIGKFGVGKLASFALGSRLTYLATKEGTTRSVSVHQNRLKDEENESEENFDVHQFPADEAQERFSDLFDQSNLPNPWDEGWESWTLAVVSDIPEEKTGGNLEAWRLKNMIQTAIPTATDFTAYLNGEQISDRDPHGDLTYTVDLTEDVMVDRIEQAIQNYWATEKEIDQEEVDESLYEVELTTSPDPSNNEQELAGIDVPNLGFVSGTGQLYDRPITTDKRKERGFSDNGFRVKVRGKLVNKNDYLFGIGTQSFTTWSKFLGQFEVPGLDDQIRVQRDQLKDSTEVDLTQQILKQTFLQVRKEESKDSSEQKDDSDSEGQKSSTNIQRSFSERLRDRSRQYAYDAVSGLNEEAGSEAEIDLTSIDVQTRPMKPTDKAVNYDSERNLIIINEEHPLFDTLRRRDDFTENIEDAFKEILAARLLIHGYLRKNGANDMALAASRQIFDSVLRSAAGSLGADELKYQLSELNDASTMGGTRFEKAIVDIFQNLGLSAIQEGGPDTHDGVIEVPQVGENQRISLEAKGSAGIVTHQNVSFDNVNRHRKEEECQSAVVIAREFQLDGIGDKKSALLRNLDEDINEEAVANISLLTTDALEVFLRLHHKRAFTYSETIDIFRNNEVPGEIVDYVIEVWESKPNDQLTRDILEAAHDFMKDDPTNAPSIGALTYDDRLRGVKREKIAKRVESLEVLTDSVDMLGEDEFIVDAPVEAILQEVDDSNADVNSIIQNDVINTNNITNS